MWDQGRVTSEANGQGDTMQEVPDADVMELRDVGFCASDEGL